MMRGSGQARLPVALAASALLLGGCGLLSHSSSPTTTLPPLPPELVGFVSLIGSGSAIGTGSTVEAVDLTNGTSVGTRAIAVGTFPDAEAITADAKTVYVANYASNSVTPISVATGRPGRSIPAGNGPAGIAIAPNGKRAYVTDAGQPGTIGDTVTPIDLTTGKALAPITVGAGPQGIAITPDGAMAYVADAGAIVNGQTGSIGDTVTPIDLMTGKALAPITVGNAPLAIAVSPDGSTVLVTNSYSGSVSPISVASGTAGTPVQVAGSPQAVAFAGATAWVADASSSVSHGNNLTPISESSDTAGTPVSVGEDPTDVVIAPGGGSAWVVCSAPSSVEQVSLATDTVNTAQTLSVSGGAYALVIAAEPHEEAVRTLGVSSEPSKSGKGTAKS